MALVFCFGRIEGNREKEDSPKRLIVDRIWITNPRIKVLTMGLGVL
jgi:hypothetical protein